MNHHSLNEKLQIPLVPNEALTVACLRQPWTGASEIISEILYTQLNQLFLEPCIRRHHHFDST